MAAPATLANMADPLPSALPPLERDAPRVGTPSAAAAGVAAVLQTVRLVGSMGVLRGTRALLDVNQQDGFDCQSCAWPSPDTGRHWFEFCENGAKAVADEATPKRVTREFFAGRSVTALADESDHWLNAQGRLAEPMVLRPGATHYEPIAWEAAFALMADAKDESAVAFYLHHGFIALPDSPLKLFLPLASLPST